MLLQITLWQGLVLGVLQHVQPDERGQVRVFVRSSKPELHGVLAGDVRAWQNRRLRPVTHLIGIGQRLSQEERAKPTPDPGKLVLYAAAYGRHPQPDLAFYQTGSNTTPYVILLSDVSVFIERVALHAATFDADVQVSGKGFTP